MPTPIKVILYCLGFFLFLGILTSVLEEVGFKEKPRQQFSEQVKKNREVYMMNWEKVIPNKGAFVDNTFVVMHKNKTNPFKNKDDFAMEFHPEIVQGVTCESLGVEFIQIRSIHHDDLLSGIRCEKRK